MLKKINLKPSLLVLMGIMLVNALSYGTIIPLLYPYASKFDIGPKELSWLFASFSLAQLIATPIIGRLSDKFGRKPLLLLCIGGTSLSLALFASAQTAVVIFIARILDGITGGNVSVAQAVLADSVKGKERAQAFGMLGAAFGFGFLLGPAIGGLLSVVSLTAPFWFAAGLAALATIGGIFFLEETLPEKGRQLSTEPYFSVKTVMKAMRHPLIGSVLAVTLIFGTALHAWIIGFQTFSNDVLKLSAKDIGLMFAGFGLISVIMQAWGIRVLMKKVKSKKLILQVSFLASVATVAPLYFVNNYWLFFAVITVFGVVSSPMMPVIAGLLSEGTKSEDQGGILGINQSLNSLSQIVGPLMAGVIAVRSVNMVFVASAAIFLFGWLWTQRMSVVKKKADL